MTLQRLLIFSASVIALTCASNAQTPKSALLALSKRDHTLAIIDPADLKVVATVPVGDDPHEVAASADGLTAYVSNYGFGSLHTLAVIDLTAHKALEPIDLGALRGPHGLVFIQGKVWFTAEAAKSIGSYDPTARKVDWIMGTGQDRTHMLYVSPDAKHIVTTNVSSATVTILEKTEGSMGRPPGPPPGMAHPPGGPGGRGPRGGPPPGPRGGDWTEIVIPVGRGSEGFDVSPNGKEAWVANAEDGTISIIDLTAKKVSETLPSNTTGANRLKFTTDGKLVLVTAGSALVVLDSSTRKEVKRLTGVHGSGGIQMQPDGARAYVACGEDGYVAVVDLKTLTMVGRVDVGEPDGLAWAVQP